MLFGSVSLIIMYFTGQKTLDYVDHFPGVSDAVVEIHAKFAEISFYLCCLLIPFCILGLFFNFLKKEKLHKFTVIMTILICGILSYFCIKTTY